MLTGDKSLPKLRQGCCKALVDAFLAKRNYNTYCEKTVNICWFVLQRLRVFPVVLQYFSKQGVHGVMTPEQLFNDVTGLDIQGEGADFSAQVYIRNLFCGLTMYRATV